MIFSFKKGDSISDNNNGLKLKIHSGLIKTPGLVNYWSFNSHIKDVIGGAHLYNGTNAGLTDDRAGRPLSALNLCEGSYQIPPGNYFPTGQFTITVWIKLKQYGNSPSIVTFSNGYQFDTIFFGFEGTASNPYFVINEYNLISETFSELPIPMNVWTHLAFTFDQNFNNTIYINANLTISVNSNQKFNNVTRIYNYVGRGDDYPTIPDINAIIDELKIFNRALTQQEIQFEMNYD